jgi:hypothetical protein
MRERLKARGIEKPEQPSMSVALPLLIAAADESRDELQDLWARLLAAATDPERAKFFRIRFIEAAKKMDPLDAAVLQQVASPGGNGAVTGQIRNNIAGALQVSRDEVDISIDNLVNLGLIFMTHTPDGGIGPLAASSCAQ